MQRIRVPMIVHFCWPLHSIYPGANPPETDAIRLDQPAARRVWLGAGPAGGLPRIIASRLVRARSPGKVRRNPPRKDSQHRIWRASKNPSGPPGDPVDSERVGGGRLKRRQNHLSLRFASRIEAWAISSTCGQWYPSFWKKEKVKTTKQFVNQQLASRAGELPVRLRVGREVSRQSSEKVKWNPHSSSARASSRASRPGFRVQRYC
jgi:hypothetical protein